MVATRAITDPTDRSMPPIRMTSVMPTAIMPFSATSRTMLAWFSGSINRFTPRRVGEKTTPSRKTISRPK